jgi:hypothetical protein
VRWLLLVVPLLASLAACWRTDPLYCERSADCADVAGRPFCDVDGTYPGSEGISRTCIADPGGSCTLDVECTDPGLPACSNGACRECSPTRACGPDQPVCDVAESTCAGCTSASDCAAFADRPTCSLEDGACVGCTSDLDCAATGQACLDSTRTCGACTADADCESGLCDRAGGTCVAESSILYVNAAGADGDCTRAAPCKSIARAHALASDQRHHILVASGAYDGADLRGKTFSITGEGTIITASTFHGDIDIGGLTFRANVRTGGGGRVTFEAVQFIDITTPDVSIGALHVENSTVTLSNSSIERTAEGSGIVVNPGGGLHLVGSRITGSALSAIQASTDDLVTITRSTFIANSSGIVMHCSRFAITNNVVANNANFGLYNSKTIVAGQIEHNTIVGNGSAITCNEIGTPVFRNNIIASNGTDSQQRQVVDCGTAYSLIWPQRAPAGDGNISADPMFVDASANDYRLRDGSAARRAADPNRTRPSPLVTVTIDYAGNARPSDGRSDIGAYEYLP